MVQPSSGCRRPRTRSTLAGRDLDVVEEDPVEGEEEVRLQGERDLDRPTGPGRQIDGPLLVAVAEPAVRPPLTGGPPHRTAGTRRARQVVQEERVLLRHEPKRRHLRAVTVQVGQGRPIVLTGRGPRRRRSPRTPRSIGRPERKGRATGEDVDRPREPLGRRVRRLREGELVAGPRGPSRLERRGVDRVPDRQGVDLVLADIELADRHRREVRGHRLGRFQSQVVQPPAVVVPSRIPLATTSRFSGAVIEKLNDALSIGWSFAGNQVEATCG